MLLITTTTLLREPPRALSTDQADPRWHVHACEIANRLTVLFNDEPVNLNEICTYDVDRGVIVSACRNEMGEIFLDDSGAQVARKPMIGKVDVRWRSDAVEQLVCQHDPETPTGCRTDVTAIVQQ